MDMIVVFDKVLVPWERVFFYDNIEMTNRLFTDSLFFPLTVHQVVSRQVVKVEFVLGVVQALVDTINVGEYSHVKEKIAEIIVALETMKSFLLASEVQAKKLKWGIMVPDHRPLYAAINTFPKLYPRFSEIIQLLGASGLASIPTEQDFNSDIRSDLDLYLQSASKPAVDRVKLFRLAWDLSMSAFGTRQTLYERFFFGDSIRLAEGLYKGYEREEFVKRVHDFLDIES
jgi:4-hydroxyphenylacetate 3-monooxygenase